MARQMKDSGVEWIGLIPDDWRIEKGKHVLSYLERPVEDTDGVVTCFRDGQVTLRSNRRELGYTVSLQEIGYKGVEPGDLVVHGMDGFAGAIGISDSRGKCSPVLNILGSDENKTFLMYYLRMMAYGNVFLALSTGIRERTCDTNWNKMKNLPYPVPSYEEQARIAAFLDTKCAEIDKVVEQTRATIEEYKKLKQAIITEAVTKGVRGSRPMKPSGVEWIGDIPEEWKLQKAKYNIDVSHGCDPKTEGDVPVYGSGASSFRTCGEFKEGPTVLIGRKGATLHIPHFITGRYWNVDTAFDVKTDANKFSLRLYYYLATAFDYKYYISQTTLPGMTQSNYLQMKIPVPPVEEQQEIAAYLDTKCAEIDRIIEKKEQLIEELGSYKKSLIYEYVTGKKEVTA